MPEYLQEIKKTIYRIKYFLVGCYGLRKYKKQIERDEELAKELQNGTQSNRRTEN